MKDINNWTKTELAIAIVMVVNDMEEAPPAYFAPVKRTIRNHTKTELVAGAKRAIKKLTRKSMWVEI